LWLRGRGTQLSGENRPWLLAVNFVNPHDIMFFDATGTMAARRLHPQLISDLKPAPPGAPYDREWDVQLPPSFDDDLATKPWAQRNFRRWNGYFFGGIDHGDREAWRRYRSYYFNCIRDLDASLMTVLDALEASGTEGETIVIYTSDHGEMAGAHGLTQKGPMMYRENMRVPFIVTHPDLAGGRAYAALGSALDIVPTVLAFAGLAPSEVGQRYPQLKGIDLSAALSGSMTERDTRGILFYYGVLMLSFDADKARAMVSRRLEGAPAPAATAAKPPPGPTQPLDDPAIFRGIHSGAYKFARYFRPDRHHTPADWESLLLHNQLELYDLHADPDERINLAADPESQRERILALNAQLNRAIAHEVGDDDGSEFPGDPAWYRLA
jgi:arylsulfatase